MRQQLHDLTSRGVCGGAAQPAAGLWHRVPPVGAHACPVLLWRLLLPAGRPRLLGPGQHEQKRRPHLLAGELVVCVGGREKGGTRAMIVLKSSGKKKSVRCLVACDLIVSLTSLLANHSPHDTSECRLVLLFHLLACMTSKVKLCFSYSHMHMRPMDGSCLMSVGCICLQYYSIQMATVCIGALGLPALVIFPIFLWRCVVMMHVHACTHTVSPETSLPLLTHP